MYSFCISFLAVATSPRQSPDQAAPWKRSGDAKACRSCAANRTVSFLDVTDSLLTRLSLKTMLHFQQPTWSRTNGQPFGAYVHQGCRKGPVFINHSLYGVVVCHQSSVMSNFPCYVVRSGFSELICTPQHTICTSLHPHQKQKVRQHWRIFDSQRYMGVSDVVSDKFLLLETSLNRLNFLNSLPFSQFLVPPVPPSAPARRCSTWVPNHLPRKPRVVLLNVDVRDQPSDNCGVPWDERQVCDRHLVPNQVILLRKDGVEHPKHPLDLVVVPLDSARNLLSVVVLEPCKLTEVWAVWKTQRRVECIGEGGTHP